VGQEGYRLHTLISNDLGERFKEAVPHGIRTLVVGILVESLVKLIERDGKKIIGRVLEGEFDLVQVVRDAAGETKAKN